MRIIWPSLLTLHLAMLAGTAVARAPDDPARAMKKFEAQVPPQDWYPDGYYDIRIAAEAEVAENPDPLGAMVQDWGDGFGKRYDVDCVADFIVPTDADALTKRFGNVALAAARRRDDLARIGYPAAVYTEPLREFERALLTHAAGRSDTEVLMDLGIASDADYEHAFAQAQASGGEGIAPVADETPPVQLLATAIEANRAKMAPKLPRVTAEGCGGDAAPAPVIFKTVPPGGNVMLISAFAFKVCTRKLPDPWDRYACRWSEVETGAPVEIRGRAMYQVRWPDGAQRRGVRDFDLNYDDETPTVATFRKGGG